MKLVFCSNNGFKEIPSTVFGMEIPQKSSKVGMTSRNSTTSLNVLDGMDVIFFPTRIKNGI